MASGGTPTVPTTPAATTGGGDPKPTAYKQFGYYGDNVGFDKYDTTLTGASHFGGRVSNTIDVFFNVSRVIVAKNVPAGVKVEPNLNMAWGTETISNIANSGIQNEKVESITFKDPLSPQSVGPRGTAKGLDGTFDDVAKEYTKALSDGFKKSDLVAPKTFQSPNTYAVKAGSGTQGPEAEAAKWTERFMAAMNDGANPENSADSQHEVLSAPNLVYHKAKMAADQFNSFAAASNFKSTDFKLLEDDKLNRLPVHIRFEGSLPGESLFYNPGVVQSVLFQNSTIRLPMENTPNGTQANKFRNTLTEYASDIVHSMINALEKATTDDETIGQKKGGKVPITIELARNPSERKNPVKVKTAKAIINRGIDDINVSEKDENESEGAVRLMYPHKREAGFYRAEDMVRVVVVEFEPLAIYDGSKPEDQKVKLGNQFSEAVLSEAYMRSMVSKIRHYVGVTVYSDLSGVQHIKAQYLDDISTLDKLRQKAYKELTMGSGALGGQVFEDPKFMDLSSLSAELPASGAMVNSINTNDGTLNKTFDPSAAAQGYVKDLGKKEMHKIIKNPSLVSRMIHGVLSGAVPGVQDGSRSERIYKEVINNPSKYAQLSSNPIISGKGGLTEGLIKIARGKKGSELGAEFGAVVGNLGDSRDSDGIRKIKGEILREFFARLPMLENIDPDSGDGNSILPTDKFGERTSALGGHLGDINITSETETVRARHTLGLRTVLERRPIMKQGISRTEKMIIAPRVNQIFQRLRKLIGGRKLENMQTHELVEFNTLLTTFFDNSTQHFNLLYVSCVLDEALSYQNIAGVDPRVQEVTPMQAHVVMMVRNTCQRLLDMVPFAHEFGRAIFINVIINDVLGKIISTYNFSTSENTNTSYGQGLKMISTVGGSLAQFKENIIRSCYDAMAVIGIKHNPRTQATNSLFGFPLLKSDRATATEQLFEERLQHFNEVAQNIRISGTVAGYSKDKFVTDLDGTINKQTAAPVIDLTTDDNNDTLFKGMNYYAFMLGTEHGIHVFTYGPDLAQHLASKRIETDMENLELAFGDDIKQKIDSQHSNSQKGFFVADVVNSATRFAPEAPIEALQNRGQQVFDNSKANEEIRKKIRNAEVLPA